MKLLSRFRLIPYLRNIGNILTNACNVIDQGEQGLFVELPSRADAGVLDESSRVHVRAFPALQQINAFSGTFEGRCCWDAVFERR